jgi:pimeloyl-ACP methyl ester carboxylesterase
MVKTDQLARWKVVLPEARVVELSDVGHFPQVEAPEEVAESLRVM